jgi:hypothetical protein
MSDADGVGTWKRLTTLMKVGTIRASQDSLITFYETSSTTVKVTGQQSRHFQTQLLYEDSKVHTDTMTYVDLEPGLWHIEMCLPFCVLDTLSDLRIVIGLTDDPTRTTNINWTAMAGTPLPPNFVWMATDLKPRMIYRPIGTFGINNNTSGTVRYYAAIGYTSVTVLKPIYIVYLPINKQTTLYATPMSISE